MLFTEDLFLVFLAMDFLSELLLVLLACLLVLMLLRPADSDADALLDCGLDVLGFALLLELLFARPLDLVPALDLTLALVLDLDFPMVTQYDDDALVWIRICVEVLGRNLHEILLGTQLDVWCPAQKIIIGQVAK